MLADSIRESLIRSGLYRRRKVSRLLAHGAAPAAAERARALYTRFVRRGDLAFDIGANIGDRTAIFLALGARVVAVDPQPICRAALVRRFRRDARVTVEAVALGRAPGEATLHMCGAHTLATLSSEWIQEVQRTGRLRHRWRRQVRVPVRTLDQLIGAHGLPRFCKIDVEGFEVEVLAGLTRPIPALSFEFTPEFIGNALACARRLLEIDAYRFNFSPGDSMELALPEWAGLDALAAHLSTYRPPTDMGDVYAAVDPA